ncbi:MAG: twin-arginine translocase subunit TatC [Gemmatimonadota bacterium]
MARGQAEMPFLDHLEELRWRIIWSLVALVVASVVGFFVVTQLDVIGLLERPIRGLLPDRTLMYTSPTTPILVTFKLTFVVGLILTLPFLAYQAWAFLSPALYEHERRFVIPAISVGFVLFLAGVAMAYFLVLPVGLRFLLGFQAESLSPIITIDEYLRFATGIILAFGIIFEMPVLLVLLAMLGVVSPATLRRYRRHALVVIAILSAVLTPADVGTMIMMMAPMVLLYELSIWLIRIVVPGRNEASWLARRMDGAG